MDDARRARRRHRKTHASTAQGLYGRSLRRVRKFHAGAQRHVPQVRYVWGHDGVFVNELTQRKRGHLPGRYVPAHMRRWPGQAGEYLNVCAYQERIKLPPSETARVNPQGELKLTYPKYEGDVCPRCGNFTMVRHGTSLECDTCGGTTGRSWAQSCVRDTSAFRT